MARLKPHSLKHGGQGAKAASKAKSADTRSDDDRGELVDSGVGKNLPHKSSSLQVSDNFCFLDPDCTSRLRLINGSHAMH